jgi:hypothetical protein
VVVAVVVQEKVTNATALTLIHSVVAGEEAVGQEEAGPRALVGQVTLEVQDRLVILYSIMRY